MPELNENPDIPAEMPFHLDVAIKMIPEFDGSKVNLHRFISCCDIVKKTATTAANQSSLLDVIKTKLTGSAYNIIKYNEFDTWDDLKESLLEQYLEKRTISQIQSELIGIFQNQSESVQEYANRVERLCSDLNDACIASEGVEASATIRNLNAKLTLQAFVEGLKSPLKLIIKASRFDTFHEAVQGACQEERLTLMSKQSKPYSQPQARFNNNKQAQKCFTCGKTGHIQSQCYQKQANPFPRYPVSHPRPQPHIKEESNARVNQITITCRYCKKVGHAIEECRKRKYNNERRAQQSDPPRQSSANAPRQQGPGNDSRPGTSGNVPNHGRS